MVATSADPASTPVEEYILHIDSIKVAWKPVARWRVWRARRKGRAAAYTPVSACKALVAVIHYTRIGRSR